MHQYNFIRCIIHTDNSLMKSKFIHSIILNTRTISNLKFIYTLTRFSTKLNRDYMSFFLKIKKFFKRKNKKRRKDLLTIQNLTINPNSE